MISFFKNWIEQIAITIIIISIFELILPNGNLKKYIKVVLGIYVIFCIISPFVNSLALYKIEDIDLEEYTKNITKNDTVINQESMDARLQGLYIEELEKNIEKKVEENGYKIYRCSIDADFKNSSSNAGIHRVDLVVVENKSNISEIEKIEIGTNRINEITNSEEIEKLRESLASYYEVNKEIINIKLK